MITHSKPKKNIPEGPVHSLIPAARTSPPTVHAADPAPLIHPVTPPLSTVSAMKASSLGCLHSPPPWSAARADSFQITYTSCIIQLTLKILYCTDKIDIISIHFAHSPYSALAAHPLLNPANPTTPTSTRNSKLSQMHPRKASSSRQHCGCDLFQCRPHP